VQGIVAVLPALALVSKVAKFFVTCTARFPALGLASVDRNGRATIKCAFRVTITGWADTTPG
jgi:hypothetical protein